VIRIALQYGHYEHEAIEGRQFLDASERGILIKIRFSVIANQFKMRSVAGRRRDEPDCGFDYSSAAPGYC
jgi:hypothetical protein